MRERGGGRGVAGFRYCNVGDLSQGPAGPFKRAFRTQGVRSARSMDDSCDLEQVSFPRFLASCSILATTEGALLYPFEVVKTRQMLAPPGSKLAVMNTATAMSTMALTEGIPSLYRGFAWSVIGGVPSEISYYVGYTYAKDMLLRHPLGAQHPGAVYFFCGGLADALSLLFWVPADVVSQRLQAHGLVSSPALHPHVRDAACVHSQGRVRSGWQIAVDLCKGEGFLSLWRGIGATIAVYSPSSAIFWLCYETSKARMAQTVGWPTTSAGVQASAAALAGVIAAAVTTPMDVVKTRLQCSPTWQPLTAHLYAVLREPGGARGLFRGFAPRVISQAPRAVIQILGYEWALDWASRSPEPSKESSGPTPR